MSREDGLVLRPMFMKSADKRKREVRGREEGGGRPGAEGVTCQAEEDRGLLEAGRTILDEDVKEGAQIR